VFLGGFQNANLTGVLNHGGERKLVSSDLTQTPQGYNLPIIASLCFKGSKKISQDSAKDQSNNGNDKLHSSTLQKKPASSDAGFLKK
jgi:hypothetical protein